MKAFLFALIVINVFFSAACTKSDNDIASAGNPSTDTVEKGILKGRITDSNGQPISEAQIVAEHTVYYASYVYAISDDNGYYRTNIPQGSWQASVRLIKYFLGNEYAFDMHPANPEPFAGTEGAIRNFTWKLNGQKPNGGYYGNSVAVYLPGAELQSDDVELTLIPEGPLADGNNGQTITSSLSDIGGGEDGIKDIPLGKYTITARKKSSGHLLKIRIRNTGTYYDSVTGILKPGYTGSTNYQIVLQVK